MSLLEEIQNEAVSSTSDLGSLLRKCKVLAARLGSQQLEDWLLWESNGYPDIVEVPDYRIWPLEIKGHFSGPFGSGIRNAPIPSACLPERVKEAYKKYPCMQSIASIEQLLKGDNKGTLRVPTGDLALVLGGNVYEMQNCVQAWAEFGVGNLLELLNTVRNRILDFSLAVWKEYPNAGEIGRDGGNMIEPRKITQIFNTTVYGGAANLVGSASHSSITFTVSSNDIESLKQVLRQNQVEEPDIDELQAAIEADPSPTKINRFGPMVSSWIAGMVKKAAEGSWGVGIGAAGNLLGDIITKYYGL